MKLIHYTDTEFALETKVYDQPIEDFSYKPRGLWVSVEGENDWKWWCEEENFNVENLVISYEVVLKDNSNILFLNSKQELSCFTSEYFLKTTGWAPKFDTYQIRWADVKEKYQGIIIPKYLWECRLAMECLWYYGWDCASGCLWDLDCIKEFNKIT